MVGFVLGYVLGVRAGPRGYEELVQSWKVISSSEEVRDLVRGGLAALGDVLRQGRAVLAERLQPGEAPGLRAA
jgi:hypothetical protein